MKTGTTSKLEKDLNTLSGFSSTPEGVTRLPFTNESLVAARYISSAMAQEGLEVEMDQAGNVFGTMRGKTARRESIYIGSHYDTVIHGGKYDGTLGIIVGLELVRKMKSTGYVPNHDLVIVATNDEEGVRFGNGYFGTRAMLGKIDPEELHRCKDQEGVSLYEAMKFAGYDPTRIKNAKKDLSLIKAFLEVHIEQGPVLDQLGVDIGVVEGIVGIKRYVLTIRGEANHAGTTPMHMRKDSVHCASRIISEIYRIVMQEIEGAVATVGCMNVKPNMINVVAGEVDFGIDIRSRYPERIKMVYDKLIETADTVKAEYGIDYTIDETLSAAPVNLNQTMMDMVAESCRELDITYHKLCSGAGHDALVFAPYVPTAMIFIPSVRGISHHPQEYSSVESMEKAVSVAYKTVMFLDKE